MLLSLLSHQPRAPYGAKSYNSSETFPLSVVPKYQIVVHSPDGLSSFYVQYGLKRSK